MFVQRFFGLGASILALICAATVHIPSQLKPISQVEAPYYVGGTCNCTCNCGHQCCIQASWTTCYSFQNFQCHAQPLGCRAGTVTCGVCNNTSSCNTGGGTSHVCLQAMSQYSYDTCTSCGNQTGCGCYTGCGLARCLYQKSTGGLQPLICNCTTGTTLCTCGQPNPSCF